MNTHVTVNLDPAAFGLAGPAVPFEFSTDFGDLDDDAILDAVWAICNSYPEELHCDPRYRVHVEQYRASRHRSLSMGDTVTLGNHNDTRTRTYRCAAVGFEEVA